MKLRNNESKTLTPLPYNKTVILYTPLEGSDIIARTGISEDTDSFFHCLLQYVRPWQVFLLVFQNYFDWQNSRRFRCRLFFVTCAQKYTDIYKFV